MNIAPTNSTKTNYIGSIFGWTRNNGGKRHRGLDLYAPEVTPVYAMYDGWDSDGCKSSDRNNLQAWR